MLLELKVPRMKTKHLKKPPLLHLRSNKLVPSKRKKNLKYRTLFKYSKMKVVLLTRKVRRSTAIRNRMKIKLLKISRIKKEHLTLC